MGVAVDRMAGLSMVSASVVIFVYYTLWVIVLPFVDDDHSIHQYFLPRFYATAIPIALCVIAGFGIGAFILHVMVTQNTRKTKTI